MVSTETLAVMHTEKAHTDLWNQFRWGDQPALSKLFLRYYDQLVRYGLRLYDDEDLVKDAIQELFLKLWHRRQSLGEVQELTPYLYKCLRRGLIDALRAGPSRFRLWKADDEARLGVNFSHEEFLVSEQVDDEQRQRLTAALNQLTKRQREAIHLRYFDDLSPAQIAQVMELSDQSVYNLLYRSVQTLREQFLLLALSVAV